MNFLYISPCAKGILCFFVHKVLFYDYGTVQSYPPEEIHFLHRKFSALPSQAIPCGLYNVKPNQTDKWSKSVTVEFTSKVLGKPLVAHIVIIDVDVSLLVDTEKLKLSADKQ